jgi:glycosyltransferase involved in cell wall biosynthesis
MKKVLIITYYWPPSGGAGVQRWLKFSKYLPEFGWEPIILTVDPEKASYAQIDESLTDDVNKDIRVFRTDTFELYSVYRLLSKKKDIPYGGFSNESSESLFNKFARFVRGNCFIPDPRRGWNRYAFKKACELISEFDVADVITTGPPHSTHLTGLKLKKQFDIRWIADFRDPWTDIYYYKELSHTKMAKWFDRNLEKRVLGSADTIVTVSNDLKRILKSKNSSETDKFSVVHNGYDESDFENIESIRSDDKFIITYTGTISDSYDISGFIDALKAVCSIYDDKIIMQFVGNVPDSIISKLNDSGLSKNLKISGYVPHVESINFLANSDLLLLVIPSVKNNKGIVTGKIFEYMASLKPVLCIGPEDGDAAEILTQCLAGETFEYSKGEEIKEYIINSINEKNPALNSNPYIYSRKNLTNKLSDLLDQ